MGTIQKALGLAAAGLTLVGLNTVNEESTLARELSERIAIDIQSLIPEGDFEQIRLQFMRQSIADVRIIYQDDGHSILNQRFVEAFRSSTEHFVQNGTLTNEEIDSFLDWLLGMVNNGTSTITLSDRIFAPGVLAGFIRYSVTLPHESIARIIDAFRAHSSPYARLEANALVNTYNRDRVGFIAQEYNAYIGLSQHYNYISVRNLTFQSLEADVEGVKIRIADKGGLNTLAGQMDILICIDALNNVISTAQNESQRNVYRNLLDEFLRSFNISSLEDIPLYKNPPEFDLIIIPPQEYRSHLSSLINLLDLNPNAWNNIGGIAAFTEEDAETLPMDGYYIRLAYGIIALRDKDPQTSALEFGIDSLIHEIAHDNEPADLNHRISELVDFVDSEESEQYEKFTSILETIFYGDPSGQQGISYNGIFEKMPYDEIHEVLESNERVEYEGRSIEPAREAYATAIQNAWLLLDINDIPLQFRDMFLRVLNENHHAKLDRMPNTQTFLRGAGELLGAIALGLMLTLRRKRTTVSRTEIL